MTQKLFYDAPYRRTFSATVVRKIEGGASPGLVLDQTLFYPTSGGQPHDTGTINGVGVTDVFEDENQRLIHRLEAPLAASTVEGRINWDRRFDHMQQHTGQHLLSQAFMQACRAETISFHLGEESATLDLNQAGFSMETITAVEDRANRIIYENRPVISHIVGKSELGQYPVRKPPAVDETIRIVEIKDFDYSPCGGTHCASTAEIGIIKINRSENYKGGSRIHFVCGLRAVRDYQKKSKILKKIGDSLSAGESDLYHNIEKTRGELKLLRREHGNLKKQLIDYEAQALFSERQKIENISIISKIFEDRNPKELKILAHKMVENFPDTVVLLGTKAKGKASLFFLRSDTLDCHMGDLMRKACAVIKGRGGGSPQQAQGGGSDADQLDAALNYAHEQISKRLDYTSR